MSGLRWMILASAMGGALGGARTVAAEEPGGSATTTAEQRTQPSARMPGERGAARAPVRPAPRAGLSFDLGRPSMFNRGGLFGSGGNSSFGFGGVLGSGEWGAGGFDSSSGF